MLRQSIRPRDPHHLLIQALAALLPEGCALTTSETVRWMSATFAGARHVLRYVVPPETAAAASAVVRGIDVVEFTLRGHLVASIGCVPDAEGFLRVEALTIEAE